MTFLPIVERELRLRARNRGTYWSRLFIVVAGLLVCVPALLFSAPVGNPALIGRHLFESLTGAAFVLCGFACLLTVESVGAERDEGTLGLLFLTRVRALDVLLGKLGSVGLLSWWGLVGLLPVLMLPVLAGGVTIAEAWRKGLSLLDVLGLALVLGLFAAASRQSRFRAARNALGLLVLLVLIPFWLGRAFAASALGGVFGSLSPLTSYVMAADTLYPGHWAAYWSSLGAVQGTTWLLLVWAGIRLRRMVQAEGAPSMAPLAKPALKVRRAVGLGRWQPSRAEDTPIEWLVHREHGVSVFIWVGAVLSLSGSGWISAMLGGFGMPTRVLFLPSGWILGGTVGLVGAALVAWVASRFFVRVRRTGELELLLTTPLGMRSIVADQWKVLQRFFVWPVPLLQGVLLVPMLSMVHFPLLRGWPVSVVTSMLFGLLDSWLAVAALCWVGMWFGVKGRGQAAAILWTLAVVKGVPLVLGVSLTIASRMLMMLLFQSAFFPARWIPALLSWSVQLVVLVFYASAIGWAKHRLDLELAGVEEALFKPRLELARVVQIWAQGFHRVRHWTP